MGSVERINVPEFRSQLRPARSLYGAACLQRKIVKVSFPLIGRKAALLKQTPEVSISADVVEPMVMHADVRKMRGHQAKRPIAADAEHFLITGGIILENRRTILESLGPLGPSPRGIFSLDGKDGRSVGILPAFFQGGYLGCGGFKNLVRRRFECGGRERGINRDHWGSWLGGKISRKIYRRLRWKPPSR